MASPSPQVVHPYVEHKPGLAGGAPIVLGTKFPVRSVVQYVLKQGLTPEELVREWITEVIGDEVAMVINDELAPEDWDWEELQKRLVRYYPPSLSRGAVMAGGVEAAEVAERFADDAQGAYSRRTEEIGSDLLRRLERTVVLSIIDSKWREHLAEMDYLRAGIGLRAMGQRDPLVVSR